MRVAGERRRPSPWPSPWREEPTAHQMLGIFGAGHRLNSVRMKTDLKPVKCEQPGGPGPPASARAQPPTQLPNAQSRSSLKENQGCKTVFSGQLQLLLPTGTGEPPRRPLGLQASAQTRASPELPAAMGVPCSSQLWLGSRWGSPGRLLLGD